MTKKIFKATNRLWAYKLHQNSVIFKDFKERGATNFMIEKSGTFIVFDNSQSAKAALDQLHNRNYDGFKLTLTYAGYFNERSNLSTTY